MCEDNAPTKALMYLQTQVSSVVNHNDQKETKDYRSLMTFLLAPKPPVTTLLPSLFQTSSTSGNPSPSSDMGSTESIREIWKSRTGTPDGNEYADPLDEEIDNINRISTSKLSPELLRSTEDPLEKQQRGSEQNNAMSADRYAQRMEVFESLLEYVNDWDKEPPGSLLDFVTRNDSRENDM